MTPPHGGEGSAGAELIALCYQFDELERAYQKIYDGPSESKTRMKPQGWPNRLSRAGR